MAIPSRKYSRQQQASGCGHLRGLLLYALALGVFTGVILTIHSGMQRDDLRSLLLTTTEATTDQQQPHGFTASSVSSGLKKTAVISSSSRDRLTTEWTTANIPKELQTDLESMKEATKSVSIKIPGLSEQYSIPFYTKRPSWLSQRTFTSNVFFCPPNGHEGTITHLIGQLLSQGDGGGSFMDVGSNLGFYSLLAIAMGHNAYAFDIQPVCLFNLKSLAATASNNHLLHIFNVGMSDSEQTVINAEGGCDYENFYLAEEERHKFRTLDADKAGIGVQVPIARLDQWVDAMGDRLKGPIQVLKMDTEGAEGRIAMGMQKTLGTCLIRNWIVELTPAHWFRFGQSMDDPEAIQAFVDVTERFNYKAYVMYMQKERLPPASQHDFIRPLSRHPTMPGEKGTGCFDSPYYEILDMRRFIQEYCLEWVATVKREGGSAKGFCGNIWFQKQGCT